MSTQVRDSLWDDNAIALLDDGAGGALLFTHPVGVIEALHARDVADAFVALEAARARGVHAVCLATYELGYALEPKLTSLLPEGRDLPLLSVGLFQAPRLLDATALDAYLAERGHRKNGSALDLDPPELGEADYGEKFAAVQRYLHAGDAYQINLTFPLHARFLGDPFTLYRSLRRASRPRHGAFLALSDRFVLSLSPELFVSFDGDRLRTRPMKGTAPRAMTLEADRAARERLKSDPKNGAENLMIVDLLRNDLGHIAVPGTVEVTARNAIETYPTLHQMTSTIEARPRAGTRLSDVFAALFPCGSVTGAPKIRAMEIIHDLEDTPRGLYCGAIGWASPLADGGAFLFNVAIRTLDLGRDGLGTIGIGSGLVVESKVHEEYAECLLKAQFLTEAVDPFELLETLKWEPAGGYALLDAHMTRLSHSALYFGFPFKETRARTRLSELARGFGAEPQRVRLALAETGEMTLTAAPLGDAAIGHWRVVLSPVPTLSTDRFLYHKTTRRALYDRERARLGTKADEVLFVNERGELTEGAITNLFLERDGTLLTPPVACGLLPGTLRGSLLAQGRAREAILTPADLTQGPLYVGNSVRGLIPAKVASGPA